MVGKQGSLSYPFYSVLRSRQRERCLSFLNSFLGVRALLPFSLVSFSGGSHYNCFYRHLRYYLSQSSQQRIWKGYMTRKSRVEIVHFIPLKDLVLGGNA
jgi:hypothetical protein